MKTRTTRTLAASVALGIAGSAIAVSPAIAAPAAPASAPMLAPYYTALDLTGDDQITTADLDVASAALGATSSSPEWERVSVIDHDSDGVITITDLADLSQRMIYDDGPFELVEASVLDMQAAMNAGVTTSVEITQGYLDRIGALDKTTVAGASRPLNAIISTSSVALEAAAAADATRSTQGMTSLLLGVPIALKDNYNTADMPTTAGCGCWNLNQTSTDAAMVEGLRAEGAVILAKTSMDEFAINLTSSWSAFQTPGTALAVASPLDTSRTSGGSSGGTGAAIAANFAGLGFGTDTGGSIRVPSTYNSLVGVRPTVGLTSRDGIVPLALTQDTGGPLARSVTDAAVALDAVVGVDPDDPITANQQGKVPESYTSYLDPEALKGKKIGYIASMLGTNAGTLALWEQTKAALIAQGAQVVEITPPPAFAAVLGEGSGSAVEFNHDLQAYIDTYLSPAVPSRSLAAIATSGNIVPGREGNPYGVRSQVTEDAYQAWAGPNGTHTTQLAAGKVLVTQMMDDNGLDAIVYPSGNPYSTIGSNMRMSPNTGLPAVTVPMGIAAAAGAAPAGNVNLEFLGRDYAEGSLLGMAYSMEQTVHGRTAPSLFGPLS